MRGRFVSLQNRAAIDGGNLRFLASDLEAKNHCKKPIIYESLGCFFGILLSFQNAVDVQL